MARADTIAQTTMYRYRLIDEEGAVIHYGVTTEDPDVLMRDFSMERMRHVNADAAIFQARSAGTQRYRTVRIEYKDGRVEFPRKRTEQGGGR